MGKLKTFDIVFENNKSVFHPGDQVRGKCVLELRGGDLKFNNIKMSMRGVAKVHWTESRSSGNRLGSYTEHFSAEIEYFLKKQVLYGSRDPSDSRETVLMDGFHEFPFCFQLPSGGISTSFEGKYGSIRFWLKAEVDKPWSFNNKTKKGFTVICPIDINRSEYLTPVGDSVEKTLCCWCCSSGPVSLYAHIDRKGYCPGESIKITADFENHSNRAIIPEASLCQTQTFSAGGKVRYRKTKFTTVTGVRILPGKTGNWDGQLLKIPALSPSIINSCLIRVDYNIRITLQVPGANDLHVDIPIIIGTVPLRRRPPRYASANGTPVGNPRLTLPLTPMVPSYDESVSQSSSVQNDLPPSYAECISGSVDIRDEGEDDIMGDTSYTPMYTYVNEFEFPPPPDYSEIDPNPVQPS